MESRSSLAPAYGRRKWAVVEVRPQPGRALRSLARRSHSESADCISSRFCRRPILSKDSISAPATRGVTSLFARLERVQHEPVAQSSLRVILAQIERAERKCIDSRLAEAA